MLKLQLWPPDVKSQLIRKDSDAGKDWRQEEKGTTEDEMVGRHHQLNGHDFEQVLGDVEGQGSLACCSPWGLKESDRTEWLNNNRCLMKLSSPELPCRVYDSSLSKTFLSLSLPTAVPIRIEGYQRKGGIEIKQDLVGTSCVQRPLHVPHFLFVGGKKGFSLLGLPWVPKKRLKQKMIRTIESQGS